MGPQISACLLAVVSVIALAQPVSRGIIAGTVLDASNEPVRKAIVTLTWQGTPRSWATSRTESSGHFRFESLPPGKYDLRATKAGEGTAIYGAASPRELGELITLENGAATANVKLRFLRSATVSGSVLDPHGNPAVHIAVSLLTQGERTLVRYRGEETDDRGEYRFDDVDAGQFFVYANQPFERGGSEPSASQFLGGARESEDSTILIVHPGENVAGIDFHITSEPVVPIHGRVTGLADIGGDPDGVRILVSPAEDYVEDHWGFEGPPGEPDNSFSYFLRAGRYRIDAHLIDAHLRVGGKVWTASQFVDTTQGPADIVLALAPPQEVKGRIRIEGTGELPVSGFDVALSDPPGRPPVWAHAAGDGTFTLTSVPPGEWVVDVNPLPPGAFLKSATFGGKDVRFARMKTETDSQDSLNIVISMNTAQIQGALAGSTRAGILLAPTGPFINLTRFYYGAVTDDNGKFELAGIAPGRYKIFALENLRPVEFKTPEAVTHLDPLGEVIELAEGARIEVHPKLIPLKRAREALR